MERVYYKLRWWAESHLIVPEIQTGFRPFRSCADNLTTLTNHIYAVWLVNSRSVFVDIISAFNNVILSILY